VKPSLDDPIQLAILAERALRGRPHGLYGGLALAVYGEPRETRDADVAVLDCAPDTVTRELGALGIETTVSFNGVPFGGLLISRVVVYSEAREGLNTLDLVQPADAEYGRRALARTVTAPLAGEPVSIVSPEDFVILKLLSTRDRDLEDAACVHNRCRDILDHRLVAAEVTLLDAALPGLGLAAKHARCVVLAGS